MKKIFLILCILFVACSENKQEENTDIVVPLLLDRPKMEALLEEMPAILKFSADFQKDPKNMALPDVVYNSALYSAMFNDPSLAMALRKIGFLEVKDYQKFYDVMIETYLLLLDNPKAVDQAVAELPALQEELPNLSLRSAQEPNNKRISDRLKRVQYESASYQNLILVNSFLGQLNAFNNQQ